MQYCEFLENYRVYTRGNETPEMMHLWCGLSTLAGAAERKLWINQNYYTLMLNLYVLLLGPAGTVSKSSAMKPALSLLKEAGFCTMEGEVIKQKIIEDMEQMAKYSQLPDGETMRHASVTYVSNEFNVLLSSGIDVIKFLTDIFDETNSYTYATKKSGQYEVPLPHFNILGAAVPQYFGHYIANDMSATGLLARCIIIYEEKKRGSFPFPEYDEEQAKAREKCMEIIYSITQMSGEMTMTEEARDYYRDWYLKQDLSTISDHRVVAYMDRKTKVYVLKIAALMAIGDVRQKIDVVDIERAVHILGEIEPKLRLAYAISGSNKLAPHIYKVTSMLQENGGSMEAKDLVRSFYQDLSHEEIKDLMKTLEDMGETYTAVKGGKKHILLREK